MLEVVQGGGDDAAHLFEAVQFEFIFHAALSHEVVESLANVRSVRLVVIRYTFVPCGEVLHEVHQFIEIDIIRRHQAMLSK